MNTKPPSIGSEAWEQILFNLVHDSKISPNEIKGVNDCFSCTSFSGIGVVSASVERKKTRCIAFTSGWVKNLRLESWRKMVERMKSSMYHCLKELHELLMLYEGTLKLESNTPTAHGLQHASSYWNVDIEWELTCFLFISWFCNSS